MTAAAPAAWRRAACILLGAFLLAALAGCATVPPKSDVEATLYYKETNDPLEPLNRVTTKVNKGLENVIFKPIAKVYNVILPRFVRRAVTNFLHNIDTPVVLVNDLLQGKPKRAGITLGRFLVNSTAGLGGLVDVGEKVGLPYHDEDFGQTLALWGMGEGPYVVLPLFGPSNPRDGIGRLVDIVTDPLFWIFRIKDLDTLRIARTATDAVDTYARHVDAIEDLERSSLDYYAALRSAYRQNRDDEIRDGAPPPLDDFDYDLPDDPDDLPPPMPPPVHEMPEADLISLYSDYLERK
ncbi:MAG TPA: VacJ family lipoprotein [Sphingomonadales bacterium]|nr:VacJ family lipoprotein [Sphingomonadales bacterium]